MSDNWAMVYRLLLAIMFFMGDDDGLLPMLEDVAMLCKKQALLLFPGKPNYQWPNAIIIQIN